MSDTKTSATTDEETVLLERALFEQRRQQGRKAGRRSRLKLALVALLVLALLVAGAWAVGFSSLLAARDVEVTGTRDLAPVQVREAAQVPEGTPLARVDLAAIQARVASLPEVAAVRVSRSWPHAVRIAVTERVAIAVVDRGQGFRALSADGVLFKQYPTRPQGLPLIQDDVGAGQDALREASLVAGSLPRSILTEVDHLSVGSVDDITLSMRSGRQVMWGNSSDSEAKAEVLRVMLKRDWRTLDVGVPGRPATR